MGQKRYLYNIAKIYNANYLRMLMKRQYMHMIEHGSQKPSRYPHSPQEPPQLSLLTETPLPLHNMATPTGEIRLGAFKCSCICTWNDHAAFPLATSEKQRRICYLLFKRRKMYPNFSGKVAKWYQSSYSLICLLGAKFKTGCIKNTKGCYLNASLLS